MGRDTIQLEDAVSTISQEYLLEFSSEYFIPENLHPELPGPEDHIVDFPEGKIGVYTKKFEFANFRIPISQFLFDILGYYQIHLSQLSVIGAAKVSHFEINCRQETRKKNTSQCYMKPLDSLKNWNNRFFWVDEKVFPTIMAWRTAATKDDKPHANTYSVVDVATLDTHRTPFQKQLEELLCLVGLSRNFFLHDDEYPTFLNDNDQAPNPTKVKTGTRQRAAHEVPLMTATASRVIKMVDVAELSTSSGTPSTVERGRRQRDAGEEGPKAPAKVLRKDHDIARAEHSAREGKSLAGMSVDTGLALYAQKTQEPPIATQTINDPNPLSYAKPLSQQDVTQSSKEKGITGDQDSERSTPSPPITGSPRSIYQSGQVAMGSQLRLRFEQEAKLLKKSVAQVARRDQRIATREKHIKELEAQLEAEINMKKATEVKNS
ncbi:hypothetical protein Tco_0012876 [Tanacetum coccineum]